LGSALCDHRLLSPKTFLRQVNCVRAPVPLLASDRDIRGYLDQGSGRRNKIAFEGAMESKSQRLKQRQLGQSEIDCTQDPRPCNYELCPFGASLFGSNDVQGRIWPTDWHILRRKFHFGFDCRESHVSDLMKTGQENGLFGYCPDSVRSGTKSPGLEQMAHLHKATGFEKAVTVSLLRMGILWDCVSRSSETAR
jgi:hypothetical protein